MWRILKSSISSYIPCHSKVCACLCFVDNFFICSGLRVYGLDAYHQRQLLRENGGGCRFDPFLSDHWSFLTLFFEMEKGYSFLLGFGYLGNDVCAKTFMHCVCVCELVFPWGIGESSLEVILRFAMVYPLTRMDYKFKFWDTACIVTVLWRYNMYIKTI